MSHNKYFLDLIITLKRRNIYQIHENIYMGHFKQGLESSSYEIELRSYVVMISQVNSYKTLLELVLSMPTRIMRPNNLHFSSQRNYISNVSPEIQQLLIDT